MLVSNHAHYYFVCSLIFEKCKKNKTLRYELDPMMMLVRMHTEEKTCVLNEIEHSGMETTLWTQTSHTPTIKGKNLYS